MNSLNKCQFIGYLGKDPEIRSVQDQKVASFSIAMDEGYKNKSGEKIDRTEWVNITAWGKLAEIVEKYVKKGDRLYVSGRLTTRTYEKDGVKQYATSITMDDMLMLSAKQAAQAPAQQSAPFEEPQQSTRDDRDLPF